MRMITLSLLLLVLGGCANPELPYSAQSHPYPPPGLYPQGPMPTGQVPFGTLVPSHLQGEYYVTGQPFGTVHGH